MKLTVLLVEVPQAKLVSIPLVSKLRAGDVIIGEVLPYTSPLYRMLIPEVVNGRPCLGEYYIIHEFLWLENKGKTRMWKTISPLELLALEAE